MARQNSAASANFADFNRMVPPCRNVARKHADGALTESKGSAKVIMLHPQCWLSSGRGRSVMELVAPRRIDLGCPLALSRGSPAGSTSTATVWANVRYWLV